MAKDPSTHLVESAVPRDPGLQRLSDGEKAALEKKELSEHADGEGREKLQKEAQRAADADDSGAE